MGRLQRKKDPKKKKAKAEQAQLAEASSGAAGGAGTDVVRKPVAVQKRSQQPSPGHRVSRPWAPPLS